MPGSSRSRPPAGMRARSSLATRRSSRSPRSIIGGSPCRPDVGITGAAPPVALTRTRPSLLLASTCWRTWRSRSRATSTRRSALDRNVAAWETQSPRKRSASGPVHDTARTVVVRDDRDARSRPALAWIFDARSRSASTSAPSWAMGAACRRTTGVGYRDESPPTAFATRVTCPPRQLPGGRSTWLPRVPRRSTTSPPRRTALPRRGTSSSTTAGWRGCQGGRCAGSSCSATRPPSTTGTTTRRSRPCTTRRSSSWPAS